MVDQSCHLQLSGRTPSIRQRRLHPCRTVGRGRVGGITVPAAADTRKQDGVGLNRRMRKTLRENGLLLAMTGLFLLALAGQALAGYAVYNDDARDHGEDVVTFPAYLTTGHFGEAVFENWESEFLQMGVFVLLTVWLRQKGSPESKSLDESEAVDRRPDPDRPGAPGPLRLGRTVAALYSHSLGLTLFGLFGIAFVLHIVTGAAEATAERAAHGAGPVSPVDFVLTAQLWFQSFQNWQSEFLSVGVLVVLSIFLREHGSPESKPVDAPHLETGS